MGLLKVDGTNRSAALDFRLQSSYQPLRRRKKDQIITTGCGRWQRTLGWGFIQQAKSYDQDVDANHHEGSGTNTRQDSETQGQAPGRRQVVIVGRVLMRLVCAVHALPWPLVCR